MFFNKPAIVQYIGESNEQFTNGNYYEAYFLEYWEGERNSLHVSDNYGDVTDFNSYELFKVISDECNLLNHDEAIVRCINNSYLKTDIEKLTLGKEYKAIGRDKDGLYLVMDNSMNCYFYPSHIFEIVEDSAGILSRRSVYYSYSKGDEIIKK